MYGSQPPSDDVLLELGRLTWAAICLEDVVEPVCWNLDSSTTRDDRRPAGKRIDDALKALEAEGDSEGRARAVGWLTEAKAALEARHSVFHGIPGTFAPLGEGIQSGNLDPVLAHLPRGKNREQTNTPLTVEGLRTIRLRLEKAREGWDVIAVASRGGA